MSVQGVDYEARCMRLEQDVRRQEKKIEQLNLTISGAFTEGMRMKAEVEQLRAARQSWRSRMGLSTQDEMVKRALAAEDRIEAALAAYGRHGKWPDNPRWFEVAEAMVKALKGGDDGA